MKPDPTIEAIAKAMYEHEMSNLARLCGTPAMEYWREFAKVATDEMARIFHDKIQGANKVGADT